MPTHGDFRPSKLSQQSSSSEERQGRCIANLSHCPIEIGKDGVGTGKFICLYCHKLMEV